VQSLQNVAKQSQPALGIFEKAPYQTSETKLEPHDLIMLFTDGLYEVQAPSQELYTQDMLAAAVARRSQLPAPQIFDELIAEVRKFAADHEFSDDVCLVGLELTGKLATGPGASPPPG
jgi:serine phosphatase RsbU (regulator of sigma subunit)